MEGADGAEDFISSGLAALGIEADEVDRNVMAATHGIFWPAICELLAFDTTDVQLERYPDLSQAP
jgi:hypothetical protein